MGRICYFNGCTVDHQKKTVKYILFPYPCKRAGSRQLFQCGDKLLTDLEYFTWCKQLEDSGMLKQSYKAATRKPYLCEAPQAADILLVDDEPTARYLAIPIIAPLHNQPLDDLSRTINSPQSRIGSIPLRLLAFLLIPICRSKFMIKNRVLGNRLNPPDQSSYLLILLTASKL